VELGESRHRDSVIPLLDSPRFPVRSSALKALQAVGDSSDAPRFVQALEDESPWVVLEGARGLKALGALEPLRELSGGSGPRSAMAREVISE
jgi:HEAT repeat protein